MRGVRAREIKKIAEHFYTDNVKKSGVSLKSFKRMFKKQYNINNSKGECK